MSPQDVLPLGPTLAVLYAVVDPEDLDGQVDLVDHAERWASELELELVGEYLDEQAAAALPWPRRRRARDLLRDVEHPFSGVEVVLVLEPARAFTKDDLLVAVALLDRLDSARFANCHRCG